jgi:hypothetical protein
MNDFEIANKLRWHGGVPRLEQVAIEIPNRVIHECLDLRFGQSDELEESIRESDAILALPVMADWVATWKKTLLSGPGFVCLRATTGALTDEELRLLYCLVAKAIGKLNQRYGAFFDVKDHGLDHTKSAIPISKTRACSGFHTDSSALRYSPEVVGLMCLQPSMQGGESLLANAADLYCWLHDHHEECLQPLSLAIKRDVITPGTPQNEEEIRKNAFPIIELDRRGLSFRYMRYWIATAYQKLKMPLPDGLIEAMDCIDQYLGASEHVFSMKLARGEMLFLNNRFLCHSRTAFTDGPDSSRKRTLVRTWIDAVSSSDTQQDSLRDYRAADQPIQLRPGRGVAAAKGRLVAQALLR